jgi:peroxidase
MPIFLYLGATTGPTFTCLIADQFKRSRDGDRFFYENEGVFLTNQLDEIRKLSVARFICDTSDDLKLIHPRVFILPLTAHQRVECSSLPAIDLTAWKDNYQECYHPDPKQCLHKHDSLYHFHD